MPRVLTSKCVLKGTKLDPDRKSETSPMMSVKVSYTKLNNFAEKHVRVEVCSQGRFVFCSVTKSKFELEGLEKPKTHFKKRKCYQQINLYSLHINVK